MAEMSSRTDASADATDDPVTRRMVQPVQVALYLAGSILAFMAVAPLLWMVSMSLKQPDEVFAANLIPHHPTFANFVYVFTQVNFIRYLWNSFFVSAVVTVVALFFHSMAGYALARLRFPGRDFIFLAMFATFLISQPVIIVPLFILARALGLLDSYAGLIVPSIFNAFGIFLLRQFYLAVPRELEEAALIDGAGYFRVYWSIILPLSRPILASLAILFFLSNWNSFLWPLTITTNQDLWMVQVAIASFRQQYTGSWNYVMAASTVVALPTLAMFVVFQKRIIESIKTSGIK
jgi:multiple sugar transport system permease protein